MDGWDASDLSCVYIYLKSLQQTYLNLKKMLWISKILSQNGEYEMNVKMWNENILKNCGALPVTVI